jgi:tetratricopeptide (TPR) repeat protein
LPRFDRLEYEEPQPDLSGRPSSSPSDADEQHWLRQADEQRRAGLYEGALRYYSRALELDKSLLQAWLGQVQMLILLDEHKEAELWSRKALELFRNNGELMAGRAQALCRLHDLKQAHPLCDAALGQEGQSAYRWIVRGELMVNGRQEIDRHCFDKAMTLDADWLVPMEIALVYRYYDNSSKALLRLRQAVERNPGKPFTWYLKACCEIDLDLAAQARKSLDRCLELQPNHANARKRLAELAQQGWSLTRMVRGWLRRS